METVRIVGIYDAYEATDNSALQCEDETLTHQEFQEESDINTIIQRFGIGENPVEAQKWITNVDIAEAPDNYQDVMNQLNEARDQFMSLPAKVRARFENNPAQFIDFVSNEENVEEMIQLGLATKVEPAPQALPGPSEAAQAAQAQTSP